MPTLNRIHIVPEAVILDKVDRSLDAIEYVLLEQKLKRWFEAIGTILVWSAAFCLGATFWIQVTKAVWRWMGN